MLTAYPAAYRGVHAILPLNAPAGERVEGPSGHVTAGQGRAGPGLLSLVFRSSLESTRRLDYRATRVTTHDRGRGRGRGHGPRLNHSRLVVGTTPGVGVRGVAA